MAAELAEDMFDMILINEGVAFHDLLRVCSVFQAEQDLLLVIEGDLGIRDQGGQKYGMGSSAMLAPYALDTKGDKA